MLLLTPVPPPAGSDPYALGPALYTALIGALMALALAPTLGWLGRRTRSAVTGWGKRYYQRQIQRSLPHTVGFRMSSRTRADVLAEWQRLKTERLTVLVLMLTGFAVSQVRLPAPARSVPAYLGNALVLLAAWRLASTSRREEDVAFAYEAERMPEVREAMDAMVDERIAVIEAERRKRAAVTDGNGASATGPEILRNPTV